LLASIVGIIVGLIGLWWASERTVEYSVQLSKIFGITTFFIGFVLIAIATGLPELAITITSLWNNVPELALGDIIGSNLGDISLVLGIPAVFLGTLTIKKENKLALFLMLTVTALVMAFVFIVGQLSRPYGLLLIILYVAIIWWLWKTKAIRVIPQQKVLEGLSQTKVKKSHACSVKTVVLMKLFGSTFFVLAFSRLSIESAMVFIRYLPFRLEALGVTLFAIGTSLPELVLSLQSAKKKEYALAFGNAFGSVLEQATLILGVLVLGAKKPLDISFLRPVAPLMFLSYAIIIHALFKKTKVGRQEGLGRKEGFALLGLFSLHIAYYLFWKR